MLKYFFLLFAVLFLFHIGLYAQTPQGFNFQAVARNVQGEIIENGSIEVRFSLMPGQTANPVWIEKHVASTDQYGVFALIIGDGTKNGGTLNAFSDIDFTSGDYWLKVEIKDGGNFIQIGDVQKFYAVPYAMVSETSVDNNDKDSLNEIQYLSISNDTIFLSNGSFVKLPPDLIDDADHDTSNEIQSLNLIDDTLTISNGNSVILSTSSSNSTPIIKTYTLSNTRGDGSSQFDIINIAGSTYRYTFDGTGTDPNINATVMPVGCEFYIYSPNMNINNNGFFIVTASGNNYFEITNSSGVAENDKTLSSTGYLILEQIWNKPSGLKYIIVEVQGAGGGSGSGMTSSGGQNAGAGSGAGGYSKKLINSDSLNSTEKVIIGPGGIGAINSQSTGITGGLSYFGSYITATGGTGGSTDSPGVGGIGINGDINVKGGNGGYKRTGSTSSAKLESQEGWGGSSFFGGEGAFGSGSKGSFQNSIGFNGANGIIIITEYY